jgi:hypothetical protein
MDDYKKRAAIARFCELERRGLINHDWSEVQQTGQVKTRIKPHDVDAHPDLYQDAAGQLAQEIFPDTQA